MNNPYTSQYMPNGFSQDAQGMMPVFQNIAQQQANLTQNLSQENQLAQQAGQTTKQSSPMDLANALRKTKPTDPNAQNAKDAQMGSWGAYNPMTQYDTSNQYGTDPYSQQSLMLASQDMGMNSATNPVSNMPVVGAYGQLIPNN